jgi:hypothetical protein
MALYPCRKRTPLRANRRQVCSIDLSVERIWSSVMIQSTLSGTSLTLRTRTRRAAEQHLPA